MRKIDKQCLLSTAYKIWEEDLEQNQKTHPKYNSNGKYYQDIKMQLYHCQKGLCAYTEMRLCDEDLYTPNKWKNGRYKTKTKEGNAELEHFDESLKAKKKDVIGRKDWLWDNLFMIDAKTNNLKSNKPIDDILKPDRLDYNPFDLLEYDEFHQFLPNRNLDYHTFERVEKMIEILGINSIRRERERYIITVINQLFFEEKAWSDFEIKAFPTAFEMHQQNLENDDFTLDDIL